jgi:metal-sulfur cluster biosynthetic enzyme
MVEEVTNDDEPAFCTSTATSNACASASQLSSHADVSVCREFNFTISLVLVLQDISCR